MNLEQFESRLNHVVSTVNGNVPFALTWLCERIFIREDIEHIDMDTEMRLFDQLSKYYVYVYRGTDVSKRASISTKNVIQFIEIFAYATGATVEAVALEFILTGQISVGNFHVIWQNNRS